MADFTITVDLEAMKKRLTALGPQGLAASVLAAVRLTVQTWLRGTVQKISGPYLGVVTGTARRSITSTAAIEGDGEVVRGRFGSPLRYVRAHELGFRGAVYVREHVRDPTDRAAHIVRAHSRYVNMRARHFMRDTIHEDLVGTEHRLRRALLLLARTGRPPSVADLQGI